ncbi:MAG: phosphohydrolase [Erysipelothrix sp.]|nr:phosphohydrolase [Erysipelothrix sp.]
MVDQLIRYLKEKYADESSGHDFEHRYRVYLNAIKINEVERENETLVTLLSFLHDEFDDKFYQGDVESDLKSLLDKCNIALSRENFDVLLSDITNFGFKGGFNDNPLSRVGQIVSDADQLDAIGAIGIARAFMYGGSTKSRMYNKDVEYQPLASYREYRGKRPVLWHFLDKLLLLKDKMKTQTGKQMAIDRHQFMLEFLNQFEKESGYGFNHQLRE